MRYAVIDAGKVVNVIEAPVGWNPQGKTVVASDTAGPGDAWNGTIFVPEERPDSSPDDAATQYAALSTATARISFIAQQLGLEVSEA